MTVADEGLVLDDAAHEDEPGDGDECGNEEREGDEEIVSEWSAEQVDWKVFVWEPGVWVDGGKNGGGEQGEEDLRVKNGGDPCGRGGGREAR